MARSGKVHPRESSPGRRQFETPAERATDRVFRITEEQRRHVVLCLREVDEARKALEARHGTENREIVRELRVAADEIFDLLNELEEIEIRDAAP